MKKDILEIILKKINETKEEGCKGVEIEMCMRAYDITKELIEELIKKGFDVIYTDNNMDEYPKLLISWE